MQNVEYIHDPYKRCEHHCTHDLSRGVTVAELLSGDGPHSDSHLIVNYTLDQAISRIQDEDRLAEAG